MAFDRAGIATGQAGAAAQLLQIIQALEGDSGKGQPITLIVDDADHWTLVLQQLDTTHGYILKMLDPTGAEVAHFDKDGTHYSKDVTAEAGIKFDGLLLSLHTHTGAAGHGPQVDHVDLANVGTNTHAQVDTHIAKTDAPVHGSTTSVAQDRLAHRTATGTLRAATPTTGSDLTTKDYVDNNFAPTAHSHGADEINNRTRTFFVPCHHVEISGAVQDPARDGCVLADGETSFAFGYAMVPSDFASGLSIEAVLHGHVSGSGNLRLESTYSYGADGEIWNTHDDSSATEDLAGPAGARYGEYQSVSLPDAAIGEHIQCELIRYGAHANDTYGQDVCIRGWLLTYTADS